MRRWPALTPVLVAFSIPRHCPHKRVLAIVGAIGSSACPHNRLRGLLARTAVDATGRLLKALSPHRPEWGWPLVSYRLSIFLIDEISHVSELSSALDRSPRQVMVSPMLMALRSLVRLTFVLSVKMTLPSCPWMI